MTLASELAEELVRRHPERAASVLERHTSEEARALLQRGSPRETAGVLRRLSPHRATAALAGLPRRRAADLLAALELDVAARLVRRLEDTTRGEVLAELDARRARALGARLRFAEHTAGALMDPEVLALPQDLSAREALARLREQPAQARYNLYVVDDGQRLVGALNLRELLLAAPGARLSELMVREPLRRGADADRAAVVSHPGWREVHSLPVVDEQGCYVGAVRYRTLRELEEELLAAAGGDGSAARALGELFATGAAAVLDALTASAPGAAAGAPDAH